MPELAAVFEMTAIELTCLPDRQQAPENLADRSESPAVGALVNALGQTENTAHCRAGLAAADARHGAPGRAILPMLSLT
jgi:tight adherence protein C